jgi:hypothetical protein
MHLKLSRRRIILLAVTLVFILGLGFVLRGFVRDNILLPLIDLGWLVWVELLTVPQVVFWALFLLVAVIVAVRSLSGSPARSGGSGNLIPKAMASSRYTHWQVGLEALPNSPFSRERMERELQTLVLQVLAEQQHTDFDTLRARQMSGELDLSTEGAAITGLFTGIGRGGFPERPPLLAGLWARLLGRPQPHLAGIPPLDVEGIITWLEAQTGSDSSQTDSNHSDTEPHRKF